MKLSRRTLLSTPLAVVAPVGEVGAAPYATRQGCRVEHVKPYRWQDLVLTVGGQRVPLSNWQVTYSSDGMGLDHFGDREK